MNSKPMAHYRILLHVKAGEPIDARKLSDELRVSNATIKKYIARLAKEGLVEKREDGYYYLTEVGAKLSKTINNLLQGKSAAPYVVTDPTSGAPIPLTFSNLSQLYAVILYGLASESVLDHHIAMYLEQWLRSSLEEEYLADLIRQGRMRNSKDMLNALRKLFEIVEEISGDGGRHSAGGNG